jgi:signal transduction histidine kinase
LQHQRTVKFPLRILYLEDDPTDAELLQATLEAEGMACEVLRVETRDEFLASLKHDELDVILADYSLPSFDGMSALKMAVEQRPELPFLFVSGTMGEEVAIEALKIGAMDYVLKSRLSRISFSLQRALREAGERAERASAEAALQRSEAYLSRAQRLSRTGSMGWKVATGDIYWSAETYRIFAYDPTLKPTVDMVVARTHPEDRAAVSETIAQAIRDGQDFEHKYRLLLPDGSLKYLHVVAHAVQHKTGETEFVGAVMDDTVARQAEEALSKSEEQWRDVFENARVSERLRIAREMHDTLLQSLHGLILRFQAARNMLPKRVDDSILALDNALTRADEAIGESRDAIRDLRSEQIGSMDLAHLLTLMGQELAGDEEDFQDPPAFAVTVEGEPRTLSPMLCDEVYRIGREALRNAFRHAAARNITAEIQYSEQWLRLRISDDGEGMDPKVLEDGGRGGHWGLIGIRERAKRMGAQLEVSSKNGAGTQVELTVPASVVYGNQAPK